MANYTLEMRDDGSSETLEFDDRPSAQRIANECKAWAEDGEWGDDGASITVRWTLTDGSGDEIDDGSETVEIEPNHAALIRDAMGYHESCGDDPEDHDWTSEGEGGLDENPGVWSVGGTAMLFRAHCRQCGLQRAEHSTGSQRNPGEHDTVEYFAPEESDVED